MSFRELSIAQRSLRRSPGFTVTVVVTLALGIGAATAMFSVANAVLLQPLPYPDPARLTLAWTDLRARNVRNFLFSAPDFLDFRKQAKSFTLLEAVTTQENIFLQPDGTPEQVVNAFVTPGFARLLGAHVVMGHDFTEQDGVPLATAQPGIGAPAVQNPDPLILSYQFWQRRFGGAPDVIGKMAGRNVIVGVMQPGFELLFPAAANLPRQADMWFCLRLAPGGSKPTQAFLHPVGRLRSGVSLDAARREAEGITARLNQNSVINKTAGFAIRLESMPDDLSRTVRPALLALMGAVVLLLLIACANVANLMLVRSGLREREWAVRAALGGNRWQTARQLMAEGLLLSAGGTTLGIILARLGLAELRHLAPANLPRLEATIDPRALIFGALTAFATALLFGLGPTLAAGRSQVTAALRTGSRNARLEPGSVLRTAVAVTTIALSFVLLVASGLMLRSFLAMLQTDLGYEPDHLLTFEALSAPPGRDAGPRQAVLKQEIVRRLGSLTGVTGVTASYPFPLTGNFNPIRWGLQDALSDPGRFQAADFQFVLPGYFETMHSRLLEGRVFTTADNVAGHSDVVIDNLLAAKITPGRPATGQRILIRVRSAEPEWVRVIGVVAHQRNESPTVEGREQIYFTDAFAGNLVANRYAVRTRGDPAGVAQAVRLQLRQIDSSIAMFETAPMTALVEKSSAQARFSLVLLAIFASIAVLLAGVGLYGVLATEVRARTAEIGVRMALGAAPASIFGMVVGRGLALSGVGLGLGILAALSLTRVIASMLTGMQATDPATFAAMAFLYLMIAAIACWLPARRAANLQPTAALRDQ